MLTDEVSADVRCYLSFPHMSLLNDSNIRREFRARLSLDDANLIWLTCTCQRLLSPITQNWNYIRKGSTYSKCGLEETLQAH